MNLILLKNLPIGKMFSFYSSNYLIFIIFYNFGEIFVIFIADISSRQGKKMALLRIEQNLNQKNDADG